MPAARRSSHTFLNASTSNRVSPLSPSLSASAYAAFSRAAGRGTIANAFISRGRSPAHCNRTRSSTRSSLTDASPWRARRRTASRVSARQTSHRASRAAEATAEAEAEAAEEAAASSRGADAAEEDRRVSRASRANFFFSRSRRAFSSLTALLLGSFARAAPNPAGRTSRAARKRFSRAAADSSVFAGFFSTRAPSAEKAESCALRTRRIRSCTLRSRVAFAAPSSSSSTSSSSSSAENNADDGHQGPSRLVHAYSETGGAFVGKFATFANGKRLRITCRGEPPPGPSELVPDAGRRRRRTNTSRRIPPPRLSRHTRATRSERSSWLMTSENDATMPRRRREKRVLMTTRRQCQSARFHRDASPGPPRGPSSRARGRGFRPRDVRARARGVRERERRGRRRAVGDDELRVSGGEGGGEGGGSSRRFSSASRPRTIS